MTRQRQRRLRIALLIITALVVIAGGMVFYLWHQRPQNFRQFQTRLDHYDPTQAGAIIAQVESAFDDAVTGELGPDDGTGLQRRSLTIDHHALSIWLSGRLASVLARQQHHFPRKIKAIMLDSEDDRLAVRFRIKAFEEIDQVVSVMGSIEFDDRGRARLAVDRIRAGRLWVPRWALIRVLYKFAANTDIKRTIKDMDRLLAGQTFSTQLQYDDQRQLIVRDLLISEDDVTLVLDVTADTVADAD